MLSQVQKVQRAENMLQEVLTAQDLLPRPAAFAAGLHTAPPTDYAFATGAQECQQ